ncbi:reverse transcriptase [Tanacetum coccineum]
MRKIISPQQSAFIPGRQIQDSIVVANEAFHYIRNKKRGNQNVMALKVDLNKAFDRVEWDFLLAVLRKMGFGDLWCNWICACLTTYELEFMVNGDSVGVIKPQRGLRQGDPISPYLFIIIADVLSRQISIAMTLGTLSASHVECGTLVSILNSYCEASGQTVNFQKSSAFFSPNTPSSLRDDICRGDNSGWVRVGGFGLIGESSANPSSKFWKAYFVYVIGNRCRAVSPLHAEIIAVHFSCSLVFNHGWFNAIVESDSQIAISLSSLDTSSPWSLAALVEDIRIWAENMQIRFSWVNRESNQIAHWVAHHAFSSTLGFSWDVSFPDELTSLSRSDLYGS